MLPNSAHELARAVATYHAGCLRVIGAQNVALRDVRTTKKAALCVDVGTLAESGTLLSSGSVEITAPTQPPIDADPISQAEHDRRRVVWDRLQDLVAKAAVEAHTKEVVYGGPLMHGFLPKARSGRLEPILAPLFMLGVTLNVTDRGSVEVRAIDEPPRFNTVLWRDAVSATGLDRIVDQGVEAQVDLAGGWDPERVETLLHAIRAVMPEVEVAAPSELLERWPGVPEAQDRPERAQLDLIDGASLFLANRASPYLLADLEQIAIKPADYVVPGRPLDVLLNPPSLEPRAGLRAPNLDEVVYPFPSNAAQRQVADALEKNEIVVVQGPPGNGKSLTIANLVAHLVSHGQRVLVSSHKTQALTVVRDKLNATGQRFLFASLIGDGASAKRELQKQIADVRAFAAQANRATLATQLAEIDDRRTADGEVYAELRQDFIVRAQPEQAEAAARHEVYREVAVLPGDDPALRAANQPTAVAALRRLDELSRGCAHVWARLRASVAAGLPDLSEQQATLGVFLDHQRVRIAAARDSEVQAVLSEWQPLIDADAGRVDSAQAGLSAMREALVPVLDGPQEREAGLRLADAPQLLADVEKVLRDLEKAFDEARARAQHRDRVAAAPELRRQLLQQHELLGQFLKKGKARKWLDVNAPGTVGLSGTEVREWASFWDWWSTIRTQASGLAGGLAADIGEDFAPDAVQAVLARAARAIARARAVLASREAVRQSALPLPLAAALAARDRETLEGALRASDMALRAAHADRHGNSLKGTAALAFLDGDDVRLDGLLDQGRWAEAESAVVALDAIRDGLPALQERRALLDGPLALLPHTAAAIESAGEQQHDPPAFMNSLERALAVHGDYLRFREVAAAETTDAIAAQLADVADQVMEDARRLLGLRIQQRILDGFQRPSFLSSLEKFRRAISASPKRYERFEELKTSTDFDVDVLTRVFPCWIMRPEDACRVFPLRADVFDVLIIDEASQCNPDQVLPLFARARKVAIVGDTKQLSNEDLRRSLSGDANRALISHSGLDPVDPHRLFDQTRNSLLELISQRQQAEVFLNEHFRCRPELIAFSNERFYGGNLTVIRDRRDDRGLHPPLLVREVKLDQPFPTARGAKVNHVEAEALVEDLERRLADPRYSGMSFGVLSLFREQIEHIQAVIERRIRPSEREQRRLICSTVDGFQGDERDVILYSWRYTAADHGSVFAFTNGGPGEQRTNVALTRARHQAIHFISTPVDKFPPSAGNVTGYLKHSADPKPLLGVLESRAHREPTGRARRTVKDTCTARGLEVVEDYVACGVSIDLLVISQDGRRRAAVFVDAERDLHPPVHVQHRVDQQELLQRAGWQVVRLPATTVLDRESIVDRIIDAALRDAEPMAVDEAAEESVTQVVVDGIPAVEDQLLDLEIEPEDRADYHWDVASVPTRLASGEAVFMSEFEEELHGSLAVHDDLKVVPQWPSRGKSIDLVITDRHGRRLAVEADGGQHHQTTDGELIPEDRDRQALLEEAGWSFHRVAHHDYLADPKRAVQEILDALAKQPPNSDLAAQVWAPHLSVEDLTDNVASIINRGRSDSPSSGDISEAAATAPSGRPKADGNAYAAVVDVTADRTSARSTLESTIRDPHVLAADAPIVPVASVSDATADSASTSGLTYARPSKDHPGDPLHFEDVPLGEVAMRIAELVHDLGTVAEKELPKALREAGRLEVPAIHERSVRRFAWVAKGKHWIDLVDGQWVPDRGRPERDPHYGDWTYSAILRRARELLVNTADPFEPLLAEVYDGDRIPKLPMSIVGSAINRARRS
jgi:very-short-patch-repair endonuclease